MHTIGVHRYGYGYINTDKPYPRVGYGYPMILSHGYRSGTVLILENHPGTGRVRVHILRVRVGYGSEFKKYGYVIPVTVSHTINLYCPLLDWNLNLSLT